MVVCLYQMPPGGAKALSQRSPPVAKCHGGMKRDEEERGIGEGVGRPGDGEASCGRHWPGGRRRLRVLAQNLVAEMRFLEVGLGVSPSGSGCRHSARPPRSALCLASSPQHAIESLTCLTLPLEFGRGLTSGRTSLLPARHRDRGGPPLAVPARSIYRRYSDLSPLGPILDRLREPNPFPAVEAPERLLWAILLLMARLWGSARSGSARRRGQSPMGRGDLWRRPLPLQASDRWQSGRVGAGGRTACVR